MSRATWLGTGAIVLWSLLALLSRAAASRAVAAAIPASEGCIPGSTKLRSARAARRAASRRE